MYSIHYTQVPKGEGKEDALVVYVVASSNVRFALTSALADVVPASFHALYTITFPFSETDTYREFETRTVMCSRPCFRAVAMIFLLVVHFSCGHRTVLGV
jgi:hypothetical protein